MILSLNLPFGKGEVEGADAFVPNAFIRIERDGQIVLTMPYVEMGQGTYTSIPMLIAEELEVDLKQLRLEHAPPNEKLYANPLLGVQATGNSNAIRGAWQPLRRGRRNCQDHAGSGCGKKMECRSGILPRAKRGSASPAIGKKHQIRRACRGRRQQCLSRKTSCSSDRRISG